MGRKNSSSLISHFSSLSGAGFTLVELLVAVAIIGVLASSAFFALNPQEQLAKGRDTQRKNDLEQIKNALDLYYTDNNSYPEGEDGLIAGIPWGEKWPSIAGQPYMAKLPKDPLSGQDYRYESSTGGGSYRLYAKLERCSDPQVISGSDCDNYNYSVTSTNTTIVAYGAPTPTPFVFPTSSPTPTSTPSPTPMPKRVFVTSTAYDGNLGGLSGADDKCQNLADNAGLSGIWKAWLSSRTVSASSRFTHSTVSYRLVDRVTLIANNWDDLITSKDGNYLSNIIAKDQNGRSKSRDYVWTNTTQSGNIYADDVDDSSCNNWTNNLPLYLIGKLGQNFSVSSNWTSGASGACDSRFSLYCFEQ